jgi:hypothetical protein
MRQSYGQTLTGYLVLTRHHAKWKEITQRFFCTALRRRNAHEPETALMRFAIWRSTQAGAPLRRSLSTSLPELSLSPYEESSFICIFGTSSIHPLNEYIPKKKNSTSHLADSQT